MLSVRDREDAQSVVRMLIPERFRLRHRQHTAAFVQTPRNREMGARMTELFALRADGSEFSAGIRLAPFRIGGRLYVAAAVRDMSLTGPGTPDDAMSQAVDNATARGVVVVVAAGNSGPSEQSIGSPGTARRAITVGASDKSDRLASFSSRGPVIWENGAILKPDIVAPGVSICSTRWDSSSPGSTCRRNPRLQEIAGNVPARRADSRRS